MRENGMYTQGKRSIDSHKSFFRYSASLVLLSYVLATNYSFSSCPCESLVLTVTKQYRGGRLMTRMALRSNISNQINHELFDVNQTLISSTNEWAWGWLWWGQYQMRIYLLLVCIIAIAHAHYCSQLGDSSLAKLSNCVVTTPAPQLKWSMNITLLQDYEWRGAEEVRYFYLTINDEPIFETCYQGQTIKGRYKKDTSLLVEQLCFDFKPAISKGDKLYLLLFWDRPASQKQIIHLSFTANGQMQPLSLDKEEQKRVEAALSKHLVSE